MRQRNEENTFQTSGSVLEGRLEDLASIRYVQIVTIIWMCIELSVATIAGIHARSAALTAFGADSAIELISALVVLRRFRLGPDSEERAARVVGALLYALGAYIVLTSALSLYCERLRADTSVLGIALLLAAAIIMPLLGSAKRKLARKIGSRALSANAAQSSICAYMSWIALSGLVVNFIFHFTRADSIAALLLLPIVFKEAATAGRGEVCDCR